MGERLKTLGTLGLVFVAISGFGKRVPAGDAPTHRPHKSSGAVAELPLGTACNVQTIRSGRELSHSGRITQVTADWLVLEHTERTKVLSAAESKAMASLPILDPRKLAYISRLFKNDGSLGELQKCQIWIPRDTILFVTVSPTKEIPADKKEPALKVPTASQQSETAPQATLEVRVAEPVSYKQIVPAAAQVEAGKTFDHASEIRAGSVRVTLRPNHSEDFWYQTRSQVAYVGSVVKVEDGRLLVEAAAVEGRTSFRVPVISDFPYLHRRFVRNSGVGRETLDQKEVWIELKDILSIEKHESW